MKVDGYKFWRENLNRAKYVVAPMVDQSELAWRMMSRKYGAHLCYTPMMHAAVFVRDQTYRTENFVTCKEDRPLIAQFCTDDPDMFLKAAKFIENECDAVDLNLGCPQMIAKRGHYGCFLQDEWDLIYKIISNAVEHLKIPVTAKIRVFDDIEKSVKYAQMLEKAGVALLTVHGRTREQKGANTGLASWKHIKAIKDTLKIPVFANGNILCFNDVTECLKQTGCDGMMIAEPNLYNPALFANLHPEAWQMAIEYIEFVRLYPCSFTFIRGHLFKIFHKIFEKHVDTREKLARIKDLDKLQEVFDELKTLCLKDKEKQQNEENAAFSTSKCCDGSLPYWVCQAYIRPDPAQASNSNEQIKQEIETKLLLSKYDESGALSTTQSIKRHLDELTRTRFDQDNQNIEADEKTKQMVKLLERKRRKLEKIERKTSQRNNLIKKLESENKEFHDLPGNKKTKYVICLQCENPRGISCEYGLCRKCCKEKVFTDRVNCKGHGLKYRAKNKSQSDSLQESQQLS